MSDLRDSGEIEQDADAVLFLWPVGTASYGQVVGLDVAKYRGGERGPMALIFNGSTQRWMESATPLSYYLQGQPKAKEL